MNDLINGDVYPGQIIKLPIPKEHSKRKINKNHVDLAKLEKEQQSEKDRNTNNKNYKIADDSDRIDLSTFVIGVTK